MAYVLVTGFPGFLGSELLPRVLERHAPDVKALCLVQPKFLGLAESRAEELSAVYAHVSGRIEIARGDITLEGLGLSDAAALQPEILEAFHLAAVYDLSVSRELAQKVNVEGTRRVLAFCRACPGLSRLHYVSTCYVSGVFDGSFSESDLERGQRFHNHYEETKYLAEVEVQKAMREGLKATVYRPAIVVGDSMTGATQKYDGPYYVIQWLLRQPKLAVLPVVGRPDRVRVNVVPRDFVVDAMAYLSGLPRSEGKVYQLCDPAALTVRLMLDAIRDACGKTLLRIPLPAAVAKASIRYVPGVYPLMKIPAEAIDYFTHPTVYTCENVLSDLEGSGIRCPGFAEYASKIVAFMRVHPEFGSAAMV